MEDIKKEDQPPRASLKLNEHLGLLNKLSLDSPRSPLSLLGGGNHATPTGVSQGIHKRKFMSATGSENSPSTPRSSFDNESLSAKFRGKKIGGYRANSESYLSPRPSLTPAHKRKQNDENEVPSGGLSIAITDLMNKPILDLSMSAIPEEEEVPVHKNKGFNDSFKRPSSRNDDSGIHSKRAKSNYPGKSLKEEIVEKESESVAVVNNTPVLLSSPKINRSQSESAVCIKKAVERIDSDPTLVGDGSRSFILPVIDGKHSDLKEISAGTLVEVMKGEYRDTVAGFTVIDCRYPYEFDGGHIKNAINLHTQRQVYEFFMKCKVPMLSGSHHAKREIFIFHCEFSSQRGPDLCRYLRQIDRSLNELSFPSLHYPELYVLYGGYKMFFEQFKEFCIPQVYLPMADHNYISDCRMYKSLSKTDVVHMKNKSNSKLPRKPSLRQASMKKFNLDSP